MSQDLSHPTFDELDTKIEQALSQLLNRDKFLLEINANERSISHRLGLYLQNLFEDWDVDCEYNRNMDDPKRLKTYGSVLSSDQYSQSILATDTITVFPDILIHQRGTRNNLLVIEMKKTTSQISDDFDYFKLREFKNQYNYPFALFIKLVTGQKNVGVEIKEYVPVDKPFWEGLSKTS